jgi:hypothetical protein
MAFETGAGAVALRERVLVGFSLAPAALRFPGEIEEPADAGFVLFVTLVPFVPLEEVFEGFTFEAAAVFSLVDSCFFGIRNMQS